MTVSSPDARTRENPFDWASASGIHRCNYMQNFHLVSLAQQSEASNRGSNSAFRHVRKASVLALERQRKGERSVARQAKDSVNRLRQRRDPCVESARRCRVGERIWRRGRSPCFRVGSLQGGHEQWVGAKVAIVVCSARVDSGQFAVGARVVPGWGGRPPCWGLMRCQRGSWRVDGLNPRRGNVRRLARRPGAPNLG